MKDTSQKLIPALAAVLAAVLAASPPGAEARADQAADQALERFTAAGVQVTKLRSLKNKPGRLTGLTPEGKLVVESEFGKLEVEASPEVAAELFVELEDARKVDLALQRGDINEVLPLLRRAVFPLLPLAALPEQFAQVHQPIALLVQTLAKAGRHGEITLIAERFPAIAAQDSLLPEIFEALDVLRAEGDFDKAASIYKGIAEHNEQARPIATALLAYSQAQTGRNDEAAATLDALGPQPAASPAAVLADFAAGFIAYRKGDFPQALDLMSKAIVYASPTVGWLPEATYFIADCYQSMKQFPPALGAYQEIFKLDQSPQWSAKARDAHAKLSEIVRKESERIAAEAKKKAEATATNNQQ